MERITGRATAVLVGAWLVLAALPAASAEQGAVPKQPEKSAGGAMMEGMTAHVEEMKKAVGELRESEKALEAASEAKDFRVAVIRHLTKLDDLEASHLRHMERMMESRGKDVHGAGCKCGADAPCMKGPGH